MAAGTQHDVDEETHPMLHEVGLPLHDANVVLKHRRSTVLYEELNPTLPP